jgi:hypothetical protein
LRVKHLLLPSLAAGALIGAPVAAAASPASGGGGVAPPGSSSSTTSKTTATNDTGGVGVDGVAPPVGPVDPTVPGLVAKIIDGVAYAPSYAPIQVQRAIWAGDAIDQDPYIWGGGHQSFTSRGYDCSGSVSYVLHAAGLLKAPDDSSDFFSWGKRGKGQWMTVYTTSGHAFIEIAGIRLDTSSEGETRMLPGTAPGSGPRWRPLLQDTSGFQPRHVPGF